MVNSYFKNMLIKLPLLLMMAVISACVSTPAEQRTKVALLVGVGEYRNLSPSLQLDGPAHDAEIVQAMLLKQGFRQSDIISLVTKPQSQQPTRDNIIRELERLATNAAPEQFIYLHFAGHGSRQPAKAIDNDETDGMDEIFLPSDVGYWNGEIGQVENAIVDDEIADYINRMRDGGADVWLVFDSCHSGTMARNLPTTTEIKYRQVDSAVLGIPDDRLIRLPDMSAEIQTRSISNADDSFMNDLADIERPVDETKTEKHKGARFDSSQRGELIAFSAAQSSETTPEMKLPKGDSNRRFHGLFTYTLIEVLAENPQLTYEQLAQQIVHRYQDMPWRSTQPLFSASNMNQPIFNTSMGSGLVIEGIVDRVKNKVLLSAGMLSNFEVGAEVEVFASLKMDGGSKLGQFNLIEADLRSSRIQLPKEAIKWPDRVYAKLISLAPSQKLVIAYLPVATNTQVQNQRVQSQVESLAEEMDQFSLGDIEKADVVISSFEGAYWFLRPGQSLPCTQQLVQTYEPTCIDHANAKAIVRVPWPRLPDDHKAVISTALEKISHVHRLVTKAQQLSFADNLLDIRFQIERDGQLRDFPVGQMPALFEGDAVRLSIESRQREPQDVSILFIDGRYGVTQVYPADGQPNRLERGHRLSFRWEITADTLGVEHLMISHQPSKGLSAHLGYLEQPAVIEFVGRSVKDDRDGQREQYAGLGDISSGVELFSWQVSLEADRDNVAN